MKTCVSCEHCRGGFGYGRFCARPGKIRIDKINGPTGRAMTTAEYERAWLWRKLGADTCGPDGVYWQERKPLVPPPPPRVN